jgi:NADP-dependent 3-hydroxy acid dehydrogenase YdfG
MSEKPILITWWSSIWWIWHSLVDFLSNKNTIQTIFTWTNEENWNQVAQQTSANFIQRDHSLDHYEFTEQLKDTIKNPKKQLRSLFLNAWVTKRDFESQKDIDYMFEVNCHKTLNLVTHLYEKKLITSDTKIILNASVQAISDPKEDVQQYAKSKKLIYQKLKDFSNRYDMMFTAIWPSGVKWTTLWEQYMNMRAEKYFGGDKSLAEQDYVNHLWETKQVEIDEVLKVITDLLSTRKYEWKATWYQDKIHLIDGWIHKNKYDSWDGRQYKERITDYISEIKAHDINLLRYLLVYFIMSLWIWDMSNSDILKSIVLFGSGSVWITTLGHRIKFHKEKLK